MGRHPDRQAKNIYRYEIFLKASMLHLTLQVTKTANGDKTFVLECVESQANVLLGGDWSTQPTLPWTETSTCSIKSYDGRIHYKYLENVLPGM